MKKYMLAFTFVIASTSFAMTPLHCKKSSAPKVIKHMADYDIIATNVGKIDMSSVFSGKPLKYFIAAKPDYAINRVRINSNNGMISIDAVKKDNFDVTVTAKNKCGTAEDKFNVQIDEEE